MFWSIFLDEFCKTRMDLGLDDEYTWNPLFENRAGGLLSYYRPVRNFRQSENWIKIFDFRRFTLCKNNFTKISSAFGSKYPCEDLSFWWDWTGGGKEARARVILYFSCSLWKPRLGRKNSLRYFGYIFRKRIYARVENEKRELQKRNKKVPKSPPPFLRRLPLVFFSPKSKLYTFFVVVNYDDPFFSSFFFNLFVRISVYWYL